ncbi:MAG: aminoacyl-tRNA hydrolase [Gammaproteobacteria bacterium]|nr:aminoacyl-tRNA hydrolase [Gammaproteobacteria bacterium]
MLSIFDKLREWRLSSKEQQSTQSTPSLKLIVGLGNPGSQYSNTRHNAGERWVRALAAEYSIPLKNEGRFKGAIGHGKIQNRDIRLLIPTTFMNLSGQSVSPLLRYFKIPPSKMLVVHDEVAFPTGVSKLKVGGGLNGHRGLESIVQALGGNKDFVRLRVGVGHPGDSRSLSAYLTKHEMPQEEQRLAASSATIETDAFEALLDGEMQRAMGLFHSSRT